ncbi:hypothetical protein ACLBWP_04955 [Microbacterium sp. M1A1_1b]|uniref:hypothetical protein n=1 Tax=Curtobacterium sp. VKM Ac-2922 TaxID=2929475 RepID=UPI001FB43CAF|nr:hypothetical protein [Curtobacterium sp. VKM Ac-2922]MCJ1714382.1 hypothetical protein [Curtobacterium sp. VKM Ac-2922]
MRVFLYLAMIVVATASTLGVALLVALQLHDAARWLVVATASSSPFLVMGPVVVGSLAAYWDHRSSTDGRRYLGWWFLGVVLVDVVAAVFIVLATISARGPVWVPVVVIGGAAVLLAVARPLGAVFRRTEPPIADHGDTVPGADAVRRKVRRITVTFVIAVVVSTIGVTLLAILGGDRGGDLLQDVLSAGQLTFTATAVATVYAALPLNRALRDTGGRDVGRLRRFAKVVLRGKELPLDPAEERGAVQYARLVPLAMRFQMAFIGLLYLALTFQFVSASLRGILGWLPDVYLAFLVLVVVWLVPVTIRRMRRARAYVAQHADAALWTLDDGAPAQPH